MAPLCAQFLDFAAVPALSAPSSRVLGRRQHGAARRKPSTTGWHQLLHEMVTPVLSWMLTAWVRLRPCIHQSQAEWPLLLGKKVPISVANISRNFLGFSPELCCHCLVLSAWMHQPAVCLSVRGGEEECFVPGKCRWGVRIVPVGCKA